MLFFLSLTVARYWARMMKLLTSFQLIAFVGWFVSENEHEFVGRLDGSDARRRNRIRVRASAKQVPRVQREGAKSRQKDDIGLFHLRIARVRNKNWLFFPTPYSPIPLCFFLLFLLNSEFFFCRIATIIFFLSF